MLPGHPLAFRMLPLPCLGAQDGVGCGIHDFTIAVKNSVVHTSAAWKLPTITFLELIFKIPSENKAFFKIQGLIISL